VQPFLFIGVCKRNNINQNIRKMKSFFQTADKSVTRQYYVSTGMKQCFYTLWYWVVTKVNTKDVYIKNISLSKADAIAFLINKFDDINTPEQAEALFDMEAPNSPEQFMFGVSGEEGIWFGKHKGTKIVDMPEDATGYLCWMANEAKKGGRYEHEPNSQYANQHGMVWRDLCGRKEWKQNICKAAEMEAIRRGAIWVNENPWNDDSETIMLFGDALQRHIERVNAVNEIRRNSDHVGTVGQTIDLTLTVKKVITGEGQFGTWQLFLMEDGAGNQFSKFGTINDRFIVSTPEGEFDHEFEGCVVRFNADVKAHEERSGVKQTQLGRLRLQESQKKELARAKRVKAKASKNKPAEAKQEASASSVSKVQIQRIFENHPDADTVYHGFAKGKTVILTHDLEKILNANAERRELNKNRMNTDQIPEIQWHEYVRDDLQFV
jgi:hypothetical protein